MRQNIITTIFLISLLVISLQAQQFRGDKGDRDHQKGDRKDRIGEREERLQRGFEEILEMFMESPDKMGEIDVKQGIEINQNILQGIIVSHIIDYKRAVNMKDGKKGSRMPDNDLMKEIRQDVQQILTPEEASNHLDTVLEEMFGPENAKLHKTTSFSNIMKSEMLRKKYNQELQLDDLIQKDREDFQEVAYEIVIYFKTLHTGENAEQYQEDLKQSTGRVVDYYVRERGADFDQLTKMLEQSQNLNLNSQWAQKYLTNEDFQDLIEGLLEETDSGEDLGEVLDQILNDEDLQGQIFTQDIEDWDAISEGIHSLADEADIDTKQLDYMIEKYQDDIEQKKQAKRIKEEEERNKESNGTVAAVLGVLVVSVVIFCVLRFLRKRKLEKDSYSQQLDSSRGYSNQI